MRLDAYLAEYWPETSRSQWQKYIDAGYVKVNGVLETSNKKMLGEDDEVTFEIPEKPDHSESKLPIVFQDENVIVINKPLGILSHSKGAMNDEFTVGEFFRQYSTYHPDTNRPGIIHRLDRDTSGIMIGALNDETAHLLQKQFADRKTKKTYMAVVVGEPKQPRAVIDLPIGRNPVKPSTFKVDSKGKSALTDYEVLAVHNGLSLVRLQPRTGRTHQLRVHMKYLGTPIYGDRVYGKEADRLYLHAQSLEITIPKGDRRVFEAPLPPEFLQLFPGVKL